MPTGYTAYVQDGANFKQFALKCARAFGATIMQRDDAMDAPLQTLIKPSTHHKDNIERSINEREELLSLSDKEWQKRLNADYESELIRISDQRKKEKEIQVKYETVLADVEKWAPPTSEHEGIKDFMVKQLKESIEWDCKTYSNKEAIKLSLDEYKKMKLDAVDWSINYHTKGWSEEVQRCADRTKWLQDFVNSLD